MESTVPQLELFSTTPVSRKDAGAYYTPDHVVWSLVRWAVRAESDLLLDPACGDGRFIAAHPHSVGVERDCQAAAVAIERSPFSRVHTGDFFDWAAATPERFDCAAGNPPFIRYQTFRGEVRERAFRLSAKLGAEFTGLTASWAPFLLVTASLLRPGGRMAFVVPAAIGHAPYAAPLLEYLIRNFATVQIVAVREKLSGRAPSLVRNFAAATCTNAIHAVRVHHEEDVDLITRRWSSPFVRLRCELEGHPLGGGMLKLEPREAARIVLPSSKKISTRALIEIDEAVSTMLAWR